MPSATAKFPYNPSKILTQKRKTTATLFAGKALCHAGRRGRRPLRVCAYPHRLRERCCATRGVRSTRTQVRSPPTGVCVSTSFAEWRCGTRGVRSTRTRVRSPPTDMCVAALLAETALWHTGRPEVAPYGYVCSRVVGGKGVVPRLLFRDLQQITRQPCRGRRPRRPVIHDL